MSKKKPEGHIGGRDSTNGRFIPVSETYRRITTTQREIIPNPGRGDSGRYDKRKK